MAAAERDRKLLEDQLQDVSRRIETATSALQDLQRQVRAAEVRTKQPPLKLLPAVVRSLSRPANQLAASAYQRLLPQCLLLHTQHISWEMCHAS